MSNPAIDINTIGHEAAIPGLYFCGYYVSPTGMLREIAIEAKQIRVEIAIQRQ